MRFWRFSGPAIAGLLCGIIGSSIGPWWAAVAAAIVLAMADGRQAHRLGQLLRWARAPLGTPVPEAGGRWGEVFAALSRRAKKAAEQREEIARLGERFREVLEALPAGVVVLAGEQNTIEWLNQRAASFLGLDAERDIGLPITHLLRSPEFIEFLEHPPGSDGKPLQLSVRTGEERQLELRLLPFLARDKLLVIEDMTRLARLETMRRDFVANVSHELRTPLAVVLGFLETARDGLQQEGDAIDRAELGKALDYAHEYGQRIERLVADLLTLSSLETGAPPSAERVPVAALIEAVVCEARALSAGRHRIALSIDGPAALLGSERELASAFANLASNAVRYTPEGGEITFSWRRLPDGGAAFAVADTGIGIPAQHLPRLTERFYRVDTGRSRASGGTGLGLAIVKHVLDRHDAQLAIESTPGKGSVFTAIFPRHRLAD